jgi:hypothetical protein
MAALHLRSPMGRTRDGDEKIHVQNHMRIAAEPRRMSAGEKTTS